MSLRNKLAFACFALVCLAALGTGVRYITASRIMSYHQQAMGVAWEAMAPSAQAQTLNFARAGGLGFLVTGVAMAIFLALPMRRGEGWARWALAAVALVYIGGQSLLVLDMITKTSANYPLTPLIAAVVVSILGFFLFDGKKAALKQKAVLK